MGACESPAEESLRGWQEAFQQAYRDVQVDYLKERVRHSWGKEMKAFSGRIVSWMEREYQAEQKTERTQAERENASGVLLKALAAAFPRQS